MPVFSVDFCQSPTAEPWLFFFLPSFFLSFHFSTSMLYTAGVGKGCTPIPSPSTSLHFGRPPLTSNRYRHCRRLVRQQSFWYLLPIGQNHALRRLVPLSWMDLCLPWFLPLCNFCVEKNFNCDIERLWFCRNVMCDFVCGYVWNNSYRNIVGGVKWLGCRITER